MIDPVESGEPQPIVAAEKYCLWWALPTGDQAAVLDAFGLSDPVPATTVTGSAVAIAQRPAFDCEQVYVSPAFDGWTLVFGDVTSHYPRDEQLERDLRESEVWAMTAGDPPIRHRMLIMASRPSKKQQSEALSARFGAAHWYKQVDSYEWGGWGIAENGRCLREVYRSDYAAQVESYGDPHPCEQGLRGEATAVRIAARASISPLRLGRHTRTSGYGVIALTERGRGATESRCHRSPVVPTSPETGYRTRRGGGTD